MSRSKYSFPREKTLKFFCKRTGYYGEQCWRAEGIRFLKRAIKRANRRWLNKMLNNELIQLNSPLKGNK